GEALTSSAFWFSLLYFIAFLHLTALLSLILRWGALPLAFGIAIMLSWCWGLGFMILGMSMGWVGGPDTMSVILVVMDCILVVATIGLQVAIGIRLQAVAAQQ